MSEFINLDFAVGVDTPLGDFTSPAWIDNADLPFHEARAEDDALFSLTADSRVAGPDVFGGSAFYEASAQVLLGGTDVNFRAGVVLRWNGAAHDDQAMRAYVCFVRSGTTPELIIARYFEGDVSWLARSEIGGTFDPSVDVVTVRAKVITINGGDGVQIESFLDYGQGEQQFDTVVDTADNRILGAGRVGTYLRRTTPSIISLQAETVPAEHVVYEDPFDNITAGTTESLSNRTDPHSYDGRTGSAYVDGDTNRVISDADVISYPGPDDLGVLDDGYTVEVTNFRFAQGVTDNANNQLYVYSRSDQADWSELIAYQLEIDLGEDRVLCRIRDHGQPGLVSLGLSGYPSAQGWDENTVLSVRFRTEVVNGDVKLDGWFSADGGPWDHAIDVVDDSENKILGIGRPAFGFRIPGQSAESARAYYAIAASETLSILDVSPGVIRDGDTVTVTGVFPETVTSVLVGGDAQTIGSQDGDTLTFTYSQTDGRFGSSLVVLDDGTAQDTMPVFVETQPGRAWVDVANLPWPSDQESIYEGADPPVKEGDQCEYTSVTSLGNDFRLNPDGTGLVSGEGGQHEISARIQDGSVWGPEEDFTIAAQTSSLPVADAGVYRTVAVGVDHQLDGSASTAEAGIYDAWWEQLSGPSDALLVDDSLIGVFLPQVEGNYEFRLTIVDELGQQASDTVTMSAVVGAVTISDAFVVSTETDRFQLSVETDTDNGTIYAVAYDEALGEPTAEQIKHGLDVNGDPAIASVQQSVSAAGVVTLPAFTGLSTGTSYGWAVVQEGEA